MLVDDYLFGTDFLTAASTNISGRRYDMHLEERESPAHHPGPSPCEIDFGRDV
jgi:hypothetical protein